MNRKAHYNDPQFFKNIFFVSTDIYTRHYHLGEVSVINLNLIGNFLNKRLSKWGKKNKKQIFVPDSYQEFTLQPLSS